MAIENHFAGLLSAIFPPTMEIRLINRMTDELVFRVHKLHSRKIEVRFSQDVLDDYRDDKPGRQQMDTYINAYLRMRFAQFVDDGILDPPLDWEVTSEVYTPKPLHPLR